ncbi:hypothetical protein J4G02_19185 [Candidatus Poribacteria bacterium]|nr:hypothetical protein [Candidatus Poribacteria bacterium]
MDVLAEKLDAKLREWEPNTVAEVRERITEIINLADHDVLDIMQSRSVEQEVLNLLDEPVSR